MTHKDVRNSAFTILCDFEKKSKWADMALKSEIKKQGFDRRDAALLSEIVYGTLQNRMLCDYYTEHFAGRSIGKISPAVLNILRLSLYQIIFLDKVPSSAAVNLGVELAKLRLKGNRAAAGFVNAVLRRAARDAEACNLPEISAPSIEQAMSIEFSHPLWFVKAVCERLGIDGARQLLKANNSRPQITVRVNTLKTTAERLIERLKCKGIEAKVGFDENCLTLTRAGDVSDTDEFKNGLFYIQDAASQCAANALAPCAGDFIIDICAAPGGKSVLAAQLMRNDGKIRSFDLYEHKIELIRQNAKRCGIDIISAEVCDATEFRRDLEGAADRIICDVPCSGTGVIRKKPEIRYKKAEDIKELNKIQQKVLKNAAAYLKKGAEMIYSTCSIMECENETVVRGFLERNSDRYELSPFCVGDTICAQNGMITLFPHIHNTDGFFIAKIKRKY